MSGRRRRPAELTSVRRSNGSYSFPVSRFHQTVAETRKGEHRASGPSPLPPERTQRPVSSTDEFRVFHKRNLSTPSALLAGSPHPLQPIWPTDFPGPPGRRSRGHPTFAGLEVLFGCPIARRASFPTSPRGLIGSVIPLPDGNTTSPPGVTSRSSVPCRSHTPWYDGWIRTPSPPSCRLDLAPSLADRFVLGQPPRLRPGTSPQALQIPPRGGHPALRLSRDSEPT